jgi:hypothetical protein
LKGDFVVQIHEIDIVRFFAEMFFEEVVDCRFQHE